MSVPNSQPPAGDAQPQYPQQPQASYPQQQPDVAAGGVATPVGVTPGQSPIGGGARPMAVQPGAGSTQVYERQPDPEGEPEQDLTDAGIKAAPPWLVSAAVHTVILMVLALIYLPQLVSKQVFLRSEPDIWAEEEGDQLEFDSILAGTDSDALEEPVITPPDLPPVDDPFAAPDKLEEFFDGVTASSDIQATVIGLALNGRHEGSKKSLLGRYGGTKSTQVAVERGLEWLARQQQARGFWSLIGPYTTGADQDNQVAATAMALLAFQGNGDTHKKGKFQKNVDKGWKWLLEEQDGDGNFFHEGPFNQMFYANGQCTIALCEIYGMTGDKKFEEPAKRAINYLLRTQSTEGGWKYSPNGRSDVSVTGWIVMALQSARMAGLEVPQDNLRRVERFLDGVSPDGGTRYSYERGKQATLAMTAEAMLCRQYLGWPQDDPRMTAALDWMTEPSHLVDFGKNRNSYYWYYATQACHHGGGEQWKRWNEVMRQAVPEQQVTKGRESGSWDPVRPSRDEWDRFGGRLYSTCLSIYMLEVYYRHLPIYANPFAVLNDL